jgi:hypothetical protein
MDIGFDKQQVLRHHVHLVEGKLLLLAFLLTNLEDSFQVFILVQLWYISRVQNTINVL